MDEKQPTIEEMTRLCTQLGNRVIKYQEMLNETLDRLKKMIDNSPVPLEPNVKLQLAELALYLAAQLASMPELEVPDALVL